MKEKQATFSVVNGKIMRATSTARVEVLPHEAARLLNDLLAALEECEDDLANREDVIDGDDGQPAANDAMILLRVVRAAIAKAKP